MTSERLKRCDFLALVFLSKSDSKKLLMEYYCVATKKPINVANNFIVIGLDVVHN